MAKKCCQCCSALILSVSLVLVGLLLACLNFGANPLYKSIVKKKLVMTKDSTTYKDWNHAPVPVYMSYYVFNYTNVDSILQNSSKPHVKKLGPYTYRENRWNQVDADRSNDDEIVYVQNYSYTFDTEKSCNECSESDRIFTPNAPLLTMLKIFGSANVTSNSSNTKINLMKLIGTILPLALKQNNAGVFYYHNISQLLWGYEDTFLSAMLSQASPGFLKPLGIKIPTNMDTFIALQHNGTAEANFFGTFTIKTGKEDINDLQRIVKWNGSSEVPCWLTPYGRMINGTDGTHFKPFISKDDILYTFIPDICRSLYLKHDSSDSVQDIDLYRFTTPDDLLLDATHNPDNVAFCVGGCTPSGIMPIGQCQNGDPPAFASGVNFYQGNRTLFDAIGGLEEPNKEEHATLISIEPDTGTTMKANKRLQINLKAIKVPYLSVSYSFPTDGIYLPVISVDEHTELDEANAKTFKDEVSTPKKYLHIFRYVLIGFGASIVLVGVILYVVHFVKERKQAESGFKKF